VSHVHRLRSVKRWAIVNKIPEALARRIVKYYDILWKKFRGNDFKSIVNELPGTLRREVQQKLFVDLVENVNIFPKGHEGALSSLIQRLQLVIYTAGEYIIKQGEMATNMYFVINGSVHIKDKNGAVIAQLSDGKCFGEMALVKSHASARNASVQCYTTSSIAILSKEDFDLIRSKYSAFNNKIIEEILRRAEPATKVESLEPKINPTITDEKEEDSKRDLLSKDQSNPLFLKRAASGQQSYIQSKLMQKFKRSIEA